MDFNSLKVVVVHRFLSAIFLQLRTGKTNPFTGQRNTTCDKCDLTGKFKIRSM